MRPLPILPHHLTNPHTVASVAEFDRWDAAQRRELGPFAGLSLFSRTNSPGRYNLASRHWPHLLCWQWLLAIEFRPYRRRFFGCWRHGPGAAGGLSWGFELLWLVSVSYQRQASDRIAALGPWRATAPKIHWNPYADNEPA